MGWGLQNEKGRGGGGESCEVLRFTHEKNRGGGISFVEGKGGGDTTSFEVFLTWELEV